ncbi:hypothetical protein [Frankia tisae]|uniref:hypothetical protein n=1 Tax=Frankia tisae TaxID=2950104 RepID=UPI0021C0C0C0|nr:hypothetical protein [Frankia tisae]
MHGARNTDALGRLLDLGEQIHLADTDAQGRMRLDRLADVLAATSGPLIVCAQVSNAVTDICALTHDRGGWVHLGADGVAELVERCCTPARRMADQLAVTADATGAGVHAEASNQRSLALWQRLGLRRVGPEITLPDGGPSLHPIRGDPGAWSR